MNQKQRDLLCKMLKERADKVKASLVSKFFLLTNNHNGCISCLVDSYRLDLDDQPKILAQISNKQRKLYEKLCKERKDIEKRERELFKVMNELKEELCMEGKKQKKYLNAAIIKLTDAITQSVIQIQFAESAEEAQKILSGLPSAEELIG